MIEDPVSAATLLASPRAWEALAMLLAIAYLLLAARQSLWCWYCALVSTAIYTVLLLDVQLLMDSALNAYYMAMAVYGWWQWRGGLHTGGGLAVSTLSARTHAGIIATILVLTLASGTLLARHTMAAWPYVDSFTTWASVITTVMVARKVLENWLYWVVIDAVSVVLYIDRGLLLTAGLFAAYTVIAILAWRSWQRSFALQGANVGA